MARAGSVFSVDHHHDEPEKRIDLFRALAVGQLEESNLKQQCSCDGEQNGDDRLEILNRHVTSHRVMMPEPSGVGADLGMSALVPYGLASRPRVSVSCTIMSARHQGSAGSHGRRNTLD